jgi:hypothetical protein
MAFNTPNVFVGGKNANASEVNENFSAVQNELNKHTGIITQTENLALRVEKHVDDTLDTLKDTVLEIVKSHRVRFATNVGSVDASGKADILSAPDSGDVWSRWTQPTPTSNTNQGTISASGIYDGNHPAWRAVNGISTSNFWANSNGSTSGWWRWQLPRTVRVNSVTVRQAGNMALTRVWTNNLKTHRIGNDHTFPAGETLQSGSSYTFVASVPIETNEIFIELVSGRGVYAGNISQIVINAEILTTVSTAENLFFNTDVPIVASSASGDEIRHDALSAIHISQMEQGVNNVAITREGAEIIKNIRPASASAPLDPAENDIYYNWMLKKAFRYVNEQWQEYEGAPLGRVSVSGGAIQSVETFPYDTNGYECNLPAVQNPQNRITELISALGMPSSRFINITLGSSGSNYVAPANGYVYLNKAPTAAGQILALGIGANPNSVNARIGTQVTAGHATNIVSVFIPCRRGDAVFYTYTNAGTTNAFRFIYAEGAN